MDKDKKRVMNLFLKPETLFELHKIKAEKGISVQFQITKAIENYLKAERAADVKE